MQLQPNSPPRREETDAGRSIDGVPSAAPGKPNAPSGADAGDATLRLLKGCVEAMGLLRAKCESLEAEMNLKLDVADRERADLRTALAAAEAAAREAEQRRKETDDRLAALETTAEETIRRFADDVALARSEAANWRMRTETDAMAFEHLSTRMAAIEAGLSTKLDTATAALAETEEANARLRSQAEAGQSKATRLETHLRTVEATIADQRSRINCLQSKLATAAYAIRLEHLSKSGFDADQAGARDILDLQGLARAV